MPKTDYGLSALWQRVLSWMAGLRSSTGSPLDERNIRRLAEKDENENIEFKQRMLSNKEIVEYAVGIDGHGDRCSL